GGGEGGNGRGTAPSSPLGKGAERMRGLKLGTSPAELGAQAPEPLNPLSPAPSDVAIAAPAFALFHAPAPTSTPEHTSEQTAASTHTNPSTRAAPSIVSQAPPPSIIAQQAEAGDGRLMSSLDALAGGDTSSAQWTPADNKSAVGGAIGSDDGDGEGGKDELFAIPPRERGPDMARSPFSLMHSGGLNPKFPFKRDSFPRTLMLGLWRASSS
ncbi:hypothetical protein O988_09578, partial [Pseudogymnoascus sp. VKM F-3808]